MSAPRTVMLDGNRPGLSLVEVVVAMLVGSIGLVAMAGVMASTARMHQSSESRMEYLNVGEAKLDQLRSYGTLRTADTVQLVLGGSLTSNMTNKSQQMTSARGRVFAVRWQVARGPNGTRDVTLRVTPVVRNLNELPHMDLHALMSIE
jgi:prepilin-type N-terminal cleavage/methylation domain-containing protein